MSSSSLSLPGSVLSSCDDVLSLKQTNFGFKSRDGTAYLAARDSSSVEVLETFWDHPVTG